MQNWKKHLIFITTKTQTINIEYGLLAMVKQNLVWRKRIQLYYDFALLSKMFSHNVISSFLLNKVYRITWHTHAKMV